MKKKVLILVHGDIWGLINAHRIIQEVKKINCNYQLVVSKRKLQDNGYYNDKVSLLREFSVFKEKNLADILNKQTDDIASKKLLGFDELCEQEKILLFYVPTSIPGGIEIERIATDFKPDLVISGDTLALLTSTTVQTFPCYGMHPGPLPLVPGLYSPIRQVIYQKLRHKEGKDYLVGTIFKLSTELDEGMILAEAEALYTGKESMFILQLKTYLALLDKLSELLLSLFDSPSLVEQEQSAHPLPDLTDETLQEWLNQGNKLIGEDDIEYLLSTI